MKLRHARNRIMFLFDSKTHLLRASDIHMQNISSQCTMFELILMHNKPMKCKMNENKRKKIYNNEKLMRSDENKIK